MNYWTTLCLLLLLSVCAHAEDAYHIRPMSENELMTTYKSILLDACRHSDGEWHVSSFDPKAGYWGDGVSEGNQGIRGVESMILASAALLRYSDLSSADRRNLTTKATAAIRYIAATHMTGSQKCPDGKQWGRSWQSGMWTSNFGFGAWLMWDHLDPDLRKSVERVVASEADRFLSIKPPSGRWLDTKAEENGWDMTCIAIAAAMFPSHPHAADWNTKAIEYMMNTLSVAKDKRDSTVTDGRPVSEWVCTENLHPDYTLENHNMFHPSYCQCSSYFMTQAAMYYTYAGRPVPEAATHHLMDVWHMFETILLPQGETAFPQGMDWEIHGLPAINLFASLGTRMHDPVAADAEVKILQYMRKWQEMLDGDLMVPGSGFGFTRHSIQAEQTAHAYLAHRVFTREGEAPSKPAPVLPFVRRFSSVDIIIHRTPSKFASFSWKNRIMGTIIPTGDGHLGNPFFTVPTNGAFVGSFELSNAKSASPKLLDRTWKKSANGFETTGTLLTNDGALKQAIRVTSLGDKTVVYQDRVTAVSDVSLARELGVPIGIENDQVSGGRRVVRHGDGKTVFDWGKPQQPVAIPGDWANVDGRLGIVMAAGSGMTYAQAQKYNPQGVCPDILYASFSSAPRTSKAGDEVAHRIILCFTEITPEETSELAKSVRIEAGPDGNVLHFGLPEGGEATVVLL